MTGRWPARLAAHVDALELTARCWWQSRHALRDPPQLTNLHDLARALGRSATR